MKRPAREAVWDRFTIGIAARHGTLVAHPDTGEVYWSGSPSWTDPATAVVHRPSQWVHVPADIVARIHAEAEGLCAGEYLAWDGSGLLVCGGPA